MDCTKERFCNNLPPNEFSRALTLRNCIAVLIQLATPLCNVDRLRPRLQRHQVCGGPQGGLTPFGEPMRVRLGLHLPAFVILWSFCIVGSVILQCD